MGHNFLNGRKDPPKSLNWWPAHSFLSCDGRTAVNTGPWVTADGKPGGYFTTVWQRTAGKWRWVYDGGGPLAASAKPPTKAVKAQIHARAARKGARRADHRTAAPYQPQGPHNA